MSTEPGFLDYLCAQRVMLPALHIMLWVTLLFNTGAYFVVEGDAGTEVIIAFNFVGIIVLLLASGLVLLKCRQIRTA